MDVSDILGLTIDDITHQADKERIFIMIVRQKTGESAKSFLSTEATRYIRKYIENYRKEAFGDEKVFVNHVETHPTGIVNKHEVDYTKPMEVANIDNNFRRCAVQKMGIKIQIRKQSPIRPKRLRKFLKRSLD